jgi:hypothetical protein
VIASVAGTTHSLKSGQDLLIGEDLSEEEFISIDQADSPIAASMEKLSNSVKRRTSPVMAAVRREVMLPTHHFALDLERYPGKHCWTRPRFSRCPSS